MFDPGTLQPIKKIDVGKGPDGIYYDAGSKRVFTNNHGTHDVSAIDAVSGNVVGTVKVEGDGEQAILADGLVYLNSEDTNEVVVFDPKALIVNKCLLIGAAMLCPGRWWPVSRSGPAPIGLILRRAPSWFLFPPGRES